MLARIVSGGQYRGLAAARKSAMSSELAYHRVLASSNAAVSPALGSLQDLYRDGDVVAQQRRELVSGVASCVGTRANGSAIATGSTGYKTFAVRATDRAGNVTDRSVTYRVGAVTTEPEDPCGAYVAKTGTRTMLPC
jgi:hypothetical protein